MNVLIKSATIVDPKSDFHNQTLDILIEKGVIKQIAKRISNSINYKEIKRDNLHVSAGWFDGSVSFGEPGYEERETIENGVKTAALSGFTDILLNTNTNPIPDKSTSIGFLNNLSKAYNNTNINLLGSLTIGSKGEALADLFDMLEKGALAFSDYKK